MSSARPAVLAVNIGFSVVSLFTGLTRLHRTVIQAKSFQIHDAMLVGALVCGITEAVLQCVSTKFGLGQNMLIDPRDLNPHDTTNYLKLYVSIFVAYFACNMFVKLSLLSFYRKLSPDNRYTWILVVMAIVAIVFGIGSVLTALMACIPLTKLWNPSQPGMCINLEAFYYANGSFMIFNDIFLYILPIFIVRGVQLSKAKARAMNLLFALGFIVIIASVMRMVAIHNMFSTPHYSLYYEAILLVWCTVENHLALIIVCLPAVKAALIAVTPSLSSGPSSLWSKISGKKQSGSSDVLGHSSAATASRASSKKAKSWFSDRSTVDDKSRVSIVAGRRAGPHGGGYNGASDEIELRKDVYVTVSDEAQSMSDAHSMYSSKSPV